MFSIFVKICSSVGAKFISFHSFSCLYEISLNFVLICNADRYGEERSTITPTGPRNQTTNRY